MNPFLSFSAGAALLVTGLSKVWLHLNTATTLSIPGCLGTDFSIVLSSSPPSLAHCWGCYVALFGVLIMAVSIGSRLFDIPTATSNRAESRFTS